MPVCLLTEIHISYLKTLFIFNFSGIMVRFLLLGMLFFAMTFSVRAQQVAISAIPPWVETPVLGVNLKRENQLGEGFRYLLFEKQVNMPSQEVFHRYSVQVLSPDGIQEFSDFVVDFDPTYQRLEI